MSKELKKSKRSKGSKKNLPDISTMPIFKPISIADIGTVNDPCFGKGYDLTTKECKQCGDSELCLVMFSKVNNTTRDKLNEENHYKDLDTLIDIKGVKKHIRKLKRDGKSKKEILEAVQTKFEIAYADARTIYKEYIKAKKS